MLLFQNSPYGWPVIGYEKDLNTLQEQDAKDFYHTFYAPNNATIVISGNVDPSEAVMTIDKHYGKLEKKPLPPQPLNTADPFTISKKRKKLKLNLLNDKVIISYPIGPITDPEHPIRTILANLLTSGNSTRLSRALIDQNIATSVFAHAQNHMLNSSFQIEVDLQHKKKASLAEKIVLSELKKLCGGMIELEELNRAKLQIQYHLYSALYNRSHSAFLIGFYETVAGNFELLQEQFEAIQKIQPEEVLTVAKKIFKPENRFVITGVTH
jgi:predicted Zn-dependent peptidase